MNKTVTVNIAGIVFHIEEQAYEKLKKYLDNIKSHFSASDGRDEIIQDIEARIAEMFQEKNQDSKEVILDADVESVIATMGRPEQLFDETEKPQPEPARFNTSSGSSQPRSAYTGSRRLYRDADDKVIGGVCSGFGYYFNIDPVWIRLAFAVAFFVFGSGFLLYIILWIVMPKAVSTAEKLEMRGEPVNIDNIRRRVEEEVKSDLNNLKGGSHSFSRGGDTTIRAKSFVSRFFEGVGEVLKGLLKLFVAFFGLILTIVGLAVFIGFIALVLGLLGIAKTDIPEEFTDMFLSPSQQFWAAAAFFLVICLPFLMLLYKGIKLLFRIKQSSRILNMTVLALWLIGVTIGITLGFNISREYREKEVDRTTIDIMQPKGNMLTLKTHREEVEHDYESDDLFFGNSGFNVTYSKDTIIRTRKVKLDVQKSLTDSFELVKIQTAKGPNRKIAHDNALNMNYQMEQHDTVLVFSEGFYLPKKSKFRDQSIQLILKVPVGKSIYLDRSIENIIYDISNVTNTWDYEMVGHTWTMTDQGLQCKDCPTDSDHKKKKRSDDNINIKIGGKGIDIHGVDHGDSLDLTGKDVNIKINEDGIKINSK